MLPPMPAPGSPIRPSARKVSLRSALARAASEAGREARDDRAARRLLTLPDVAAAGCVAAFVALPPEPDTGPLLALADRGVRVLLPVLRSDGLLSWRVHEGPLEPGLRGTWQPPATAASAPLTDADVVVVPAVAVDPTGRRLGRGGGSYDRALAGRRPDSLLVALVGDAAVVAEVPVEPHDIAVDLVVTPTRVLAAASTRER
jgi:5-formyltetrahydrofolate cyclo-ligase